LVSIFGRIMNHPSKKNENRFQQRPEELDVIVSLGQQISIIQPLEEVVEKSVKCVVDTIDADLAVLYLTQDQKLLLRGAYPPEWISEEDHKMQAIGESLCGLVLSQKKPIVSSDIQTDSNRNFDECKQAGIKSLAILPLSTGHEILGVLGIASKERRDFEEKLEFLQVISSQISVGIQNARIFEELQAELEARSEAGRGLLEEALQRQAALAEIELTINQPRELQTALDRVVEITTQLLPATGGASVALLDEMSFEIWIGSSTVAEPLKAEIDRFIRKSDGISRWIIKNNKPVIVEDTSKDPFDIDGVLFKHSIGAYIGMPLIFEAEVFGLLYVFNQSNRRYTEQDIDFLVGLANRAALAIAKVKLYGTLLKVRTSAEETARTKDQFLANISHELRTPMTAVVSFSELLKETELDNYQADLVHTISTSAERLLTLINDILDYSKLDVNKLSLEAQPYDLRLCIENVLAQEKVSSRRKGLELAYLVEDGIPEYLLGDVTRLCQVLTNLVNNAVKFTEKGEIMLLVRELSPIAQSASSEPTNKRIKLLFKINDTGIGIPPEKITKLFVPFEQVDASTTRKFGGTGLGLAISRQIVQLMGGEIWAESSGVSGDGSTFYFTIETQALDAPVPLYLYKKQPLLGGKKVLLVSNANNHRHVASNLLTYWGMQVAAFGTCQQAYAWLQAAERLDLVVIILSQSQEEHRLLVEEIYEHWEPRTTPLIIISSTENMVDTSWASAVIGMLTTPIRPLHLYNLLVQIYSQPIKIKPIPEPKVAKVVEHSRKILIVEDDPVNRKVVAMMLDHLGYQYETSENGIDAIAALEHQPFDIVIMDLQMPLMDGITATRYIRELIPEGQQPFIIALTADAREEAREDMNAAGANVHVVKPFSNLTLAQALDRADEYLFDRISPAQLSTQETEIEQADKGVLDESVLTDFINIMGDEAPTKLVELIQLFLENVPDLIKDMKFAAAEKDWQQVKWSAHTLKGNCELLGGARLFQMCKQLENRISLGELSDVTERVEEIDVEFNAVKLALLDVQSTYNSNS
jgi:signal transduction histidine kinase/CheY-like chemotaxis protein/HPt (histidine-containing phosphotransfer) domain-containing protein/putative methionine-R-sulfoxide reductase with GAF domain